MGIHFQFEESHRDVCAMSFEHPWTWEEFGAQVDAMWRAAQAMPHRVAALVDMTRIGHLPGGNVLAHLQRLDSSAPDNVEMIVLVNAPYAIVNFMSIVMRVSPHVKETTVYAHSLAEARMIIEDRRQHNYLTHL
jgi:hypothetical protein